MPSHGNDHDYQSEHALEEALISTLVSQGYTRVNITNEAGLVANLRDHVERLNGVSFTDSEWDKLLVEFIAKPEDTVLDKTKRIQHDRAVYTFEFDDGHFDNIILIDFDNPHNNRFEVLNQYRVDTTAGAKRNNRYDVTILLNGLPITHIELKRRGVSITEAFNQINRYTRDSFSTSHKLFDYVHVYVISNGTLTKYYSNTTRELQIKSAAGKRAKTSKKSSTFKFTMWWSDVKNKQITDLVDFSRTFLATRSLFNIIAKYCVLDINDILMIMRPYQIAATERILNKVQTNINSPKALGTRNSRGYVWHTTGSGKTLTSFKTAQLVTQFDEVAKVIFVVDRQDLDYQTMKEYDKFEKGAANGNNSTRVLRSQLADDQVKIIVTTIQKLNHLAGQSDSLDIFGKHVVFIFDECHRSQFGSMHKRISKRFKKTSMFGFTGTPIFHTPEDEKKRRSDMPVVETTEHVFGAMLHQYIITDAIRDENVLPFNVQNFKTIHSNVNEDKKVSAINRERALMAPERVSAIVTHILDNYAAHTSRSSKFNHVVQDYDPLAYKRGRDTSKMVVTVNGFNAMMAVSSIPAAKAYYTEFAAQMEQLPENRKLKVATIFSATTGETAVSDPDGFIIDEDMEADNLSGDDKDFLIRAVTDYNSAMGTSFDISDQNGFQNYYRDLSQRMKNRQVDLLIVVNMFLTGFDAQTLNTLYVDKNLRQHGLIQAFSRTNRILNSRKSAGNIMCYRNLEQEIRDAVQRFGDSEAYNVVVLQSYECYLDKYKQAVTSLKEQYVPGEIPTGEKAQRDFVKQYTALLRLTNVLDLFEQFGDDTTLSPRDMQDYQSVYLHLHEVLTRDDGDDPVDIVEDLEFDIQLANKFSVDVDYIIELVLELKDSRGNITDDDHARVRRELESSPRLRLKSELIEQFINQLQGDSTIEDFYALATRRFTSEIDALITEYKLKKRETYQFVIRGLATGSVSAAGMGAANIMPPIRRFGTAVSPKVSKTEVISAINMLIERYGDVANEAALAADN
jgi:type I restriction enzyme R subunit